MILCDAGPLIALVDRADARHLDCRSVLESIRPPLVTTWSCLAEAMFILGRRLGFDAQQRLWQLVLSPAIKVHEHTPPEAEHMRALMLKYRDLPMDFADACLVAAADSLGVRAIFTLDGDFRVYRTAQGEPFEILP